MFSRFFRPFACAAGVVVATAAPTAARFSVPRPHWPFPPVEVPVPHLPPINGIPGVPDLELRRVDELRRQANDVIHRFNGLVRDQG